MERFLNISPSILKVPGRPPEGAYMVDHLKVPIW